MRRSTIEGLRIAWRAMQDTHEFFGMLGKFKVGRMQALRLVGEEFARELPPRALRSALEAAGADGTPIMIFVGSNGCIQIHSGPIKRLVETHGWFNVLDPAFNLHLREAGVARLFSVRKPTEDGIVTSIEAFDASQPQHPADVRRSQTRQTRARRMARPGGADREAGRLVIGRPMISRRGALALGFAAAAASPVRAQTPPRIVSVGSSLTEIVYALGAENLLVGRRYRPASFPRRRGRCLRSATCARCRPKACCR